MAEFQILGPLEVEAGGAPVAIGGHRQRALLAVLLLEANRVVSTDRLIDELWGAQPPRTAATSLQNAVAALRKAIGAEALATRAPGYVLSVGEDELDANRFARLVEQASGAPAGRRAALLREALALWRGPALADLAFERFAEAEARRLAELRLVALEGRIDADLELGRHAELVGELEGLVVDHPLRERLRALHMLALYRAGRQAEALEAYQGARRALAAELGIDPGPALQSLHASILRQDAGIAPVRNGRRPADTASLDEVARAVLAGRLVPVLGAEVSQLAAQLAARFGTPPDEGGALTRVAQYVALEQGSGPLYDSLHELLAAGVATPVHRFLAALAGFLRARDLPHQLVVTTGYDLALELALHEASEEFDVVSYLASGRHRGRFCHAAPDGTARPIDVPNTYASELSLARRTVLLKLHGGVDPAPERTWESFVVTEDDYIDYLADTELAAAVPVGLVATLRRSHLLFLGYGMRDWNLRMVLSRVWGSAGLTYRSWAVAPRASVTEQRFWQARGVELVDVEPEAYVEALAGQLGLAVERAAP